MRAVVLVVRVVATPFRGSSAPFRFRRSSLGVPGGSFASSRRVAFDTGAL
jgi:hypothetical protein